MKKMLFLLLVSAVFTSPTLALKTATPCTDGYRACIAAGGSQAGCDAGWNACMCAEYGYGC